jgi:hypothetical protein
MKSLSVIFLFLWASAANGTEYRFFDISVPNLRHTHVFGMNDVGDVVGVSLDCDFCQAQAFLFSDGQ